MNRAMQRHEGARNTIDTRSIISGLRKAFDLDYPRLLDAWKKEWERNYSGKDPSDACVSVRITAGDSEKNALPCGGILKKPSGSFLSGNCRRSVA
jgi:transposase-like protein